MKIVFEFFKYISIFKSIAFSISQIKKREYVNEIRIFAKSIFKSLSQKNQTRLTITFLSHLYYKL